MAAVFRRVAHRAFRPHPLPFLPCIMPCASAPVLSVPSLAAASARHFSAAAPVPGGKMNTSKRGKFKLRPTKHDPELKDILRQLVKRVHPDLFGNFPVLQEKNAHALQTLMSMLDEAKSNSTGQFVAPKSVHVEFFAKTETEGHFLRMPAHFRLTGNNCQHVLGKSLSDLFKLASLPEQFHWGEGYWEKRVFVKDDGEEGEEEEQ